MPDDNKQEQPSQVMTAAGRYEQLETLRSPALMRGRECSALTIPALLPPESTNDTSQLPTPFQSVGARGTNNLSSKLLLALFPPGASFFRLKVDDFMMDKLKERAGKGADPTAEIETALSKVERAVITRLEQRAVRPVLSEFFKHLIVVGNGLLQVLPGGALKFHTLANYVVKRDVAGSALEIITREGLSPKTLPPAVQEIVEKKTNVESDKDTTENIWLYTWVRRQDNSSWKVHQEVLGEKVPGTEGTYPKDKSAWIAARWTAISGCDYGRGHVEEYLGDMHSLESLSQSIVEFAANAAKIIWIFDEGGVTSRSTVEKAASGAMIEGAVSNGKPKDIGIMAMEKYPDFQVVKATAEGIEHRMEQAFLLNSSIQRQAERVTAEEIRFMAGELEQALGGTYSILGQELQHPLVVRLMLEMQKERKLPILPADLVSPQIITGLDGLGRSNDEMKLRLLIQGIAQDVGPEAVAEYVNVGALITRRAAALSIEIEGLIRPEQEVQQIRAQKAQQAMLEKTGPATVKAASDQAKVAAQGAATSAPAQ
jgi:hypothetical protein